MEGICFNPGGLVRLPEGGLGNGTLGGHGGPCEVTGQRLDRLKPGGACGGMETLSPWISEAARQSAMISYVNDFRVAMFLTLILLPLVAFMRRPAAPPPRNEIHAVD